MKRYEEYKKVDLPYLDEVPRGWEIYRAKFFETSKKIINKENQRDNVLSLTLKGVINNDKDRPIGLSPKDYKTYQFFDKDDLVFKLIDLNNIKTSRVGLVHEDGIMSSAYIRATFDKSKFNIKYLYYFYYKLYIEEVYNKLGSGVRETLSKEALLNMQIPIPPLPEQTQIANYLDWKISEIDKLISIDKKKLEKRYELKDAYIEKLVQFGLYDDKLKPISNYVFNEIPQHWERRYLFQLAKENKTKNLRMKNKNILSLSYGKLKRKDINTTGGLLPASFESYQILKKGMIVLRLTDLQNDHKSLRVGLCNEEGIITSAYIGLELSGEVIPKYMYYLLHSFDICKGFYGMGGGVRQSLNYNGLSKLELPLPKKEEQELIIKKIETIENAIEKEVIRLEKEILTLQSLKHSLISEVVTGKIDVRDIVIPRFETIDLEKEDSSDESSNELDVNEEIE